MTKRMHRKVNAKGRNSYEKYVQLHGWLLDSAAYQELNCYARSLLVELLRIYNGSNNGEIGLSVRRAAQRLKCSNDTASKYFKQLVSLGFIKEHEKGSFHRKSGHATTWVLTMREYNGQPPTKEFMRYKAKQN